MSHLTLYNTLTKSKEPLRAKNPAHITFYTCGPTVYDDAHIGNFRSFLAADLLRRWLESPLCTIQDTDGNEHTGPRTVRHVMNITDVGHMTDDDLADGAGDDKMQLACQRLLDAKKAGTAHVASIDPNDPKQIADFYTQRFLEDAKKLGLKVAHEADADPAVMPRATDNVEGMKRMIESLAEKGFAYRVDSAVYFDVQKFESYGTLSGNTLDKLKGGAGGRVSDKNQAGKRHPADFLLWKSDPAHLMKWPGPAINNEQMPEGYPGWHIECSVMSQVLGTTVDIHSGGEDNIFPHHECERAQSCCAHDTPEFARHWFHPRFLLVEGEKMSKSKGNFFTARELFEKHDPAAVRLELVKTHYRANANFTEQGIADSTKRISRWRRAIAGLLDAEVNGTAVTAVPTITADVLDSFSAAMNADLNVGAALSVVDGACSGIDGPRNPVINFPGDPGTLHAELLKAKPGSARERRFLILLMISPLIDIDNAGSVQEVNVGPTDLMSAVIFPVTLEVTDPEYPDNVFVGIQPDNEANILLNARRDAKKAKDFATSDAIRDELAAMGYAIKDVAGGKVEVSRA